MKLFNQKLELIAIRSICESSKKYKNKMLSVLQEEHFHSPPALEAIKRIINLTRANAEIPSYTDICTDPVISETTRKILNKFEDEPINSSKQMTKTVNSLHRYFQMRKLYFLSEEINENLLKEKVEIEDLLEKASSDIMKARVKSEVNQPIYHIGKGNNSSSIVKKLLDDTKKEYLPTKFKDFDEKNGGIYFGSMMLIGGTTGGGKSSLALQLLKNFAEGCENVAYVPLEMTEDETMARLMANCSQLSLQKILQKKLAKGEKKLIAKSYKKWVRKLKEQGNRFTIFSPEEDVTAEEVLLLLKPYNFKVIIIDYISLLKGVDGDDSWQQLGKVARMCKIYAKNTNSIVVLLVQINDEGKVRYSKATVEHANNAWFFVANKDTRDSGILNIKQEKARNQAMFDFQLAFTADTMTIRDLNPNEKVDYSNASTAEEELEDMTDIKRNKKKKEKSEESSDGSKKNRKKKHKDKKSVRI